MRRRDSAEAQDLGALRLIGPALAAERVRALKVGVGTVMSLLERPHIARDQLIDAARDNLFACILTAPSRSRDTGVPRAATMLRAHLPDLSTLTPGEKQLMSELLERIARP